MKKIVITGATGFLGKRAAEILQHEGYQVTALGRNKSIGAELEAKGIRFLPIDLGDQEALRKILVGQDAVIHSAALSTPWGLWKDFYRTNVTGTKNILSAAQDAGIKRFVHISTPSIYVDSVDKQGVKESDPLPNPINDYAKTKRMAEELVDKATNSGLPCITIRPQGIFGVGDPHILPRIMRVAQKGYFPLIGEGNNWIDMTHVDNVVHALKCCLLADVKALGKKYNITNGEPIKNYELLESMFQELGLIIRWKKIPFALAYNLAGALELLHRTILTNKEPLLTRYSVCALAKTRTLSIDAARRDLAYSPPIPLSKALSEYIAWWKTSGAAIMENK